MTKTRVTDKDPYKPGTVLRSWVAGYKATRNWGVGLYSYFQQITAEETIVGKDRECVTILKVGKPFYTTDMTDEQIAAFNAVAELSHVLDSAMRRTRRGK